MSSVFGIRTEIVARIDRRLRQLRFTMTGADFIDLPVSAMWDMLEELKRLQKMRRDLVPPRDYYGDMLLQSYA